jgi:nucleoside-diphosphate-sugar epimerase
MKVAVTGASGFVGSAAVALFARNGWQVIAQSRRLAPAASLITNVQTLQADLDDQALWQAALAGCEAVLHTAARVHQVNDVSTNPLADYRAVNTEQTLRLARNAANHGVKRFVFLSSIKVNGEWTSEEHPFRADDAPAPADPYGISKCEAELGLKEIANQTDMQVVIVRPPLVYGPGVKANFLTMMRWLRRGIPLPLGAIHNQRSLIGLGNLVDLLEKCLTHPAAANQTFLASDGQDVSTTELLRALTQALQVKPRLIPVPQTVLEGGLKLLGRGDLAQRLCGNLAVDIAKTRDLLGWTPSLSLEQGLRSTAEHFLAQRTV